MDRNPPIDLPPTCPRCGYDLSGVTESWTDACPLHGLCSECGLAFRWYDVLRGSLRTPHWSFEHAIPGRRFRTFFATLWRPFVPTRLWRPLRMEMALRSHRLLVLIVLGFVLLRILGAATIYIPWWAIMRLNSNRPFSWSLTDPEVLLRMAWPWGSQYGWGRLAGVLSPWCLAVALTLACMPLAFTLLPVSLRRAKVQPHHIRRIALYSLVTAPVLLGIFPTLVLLHGLSNTLFWDLHELLGLGWSDASKLGIASVILACFFLARFWFVAVRDYLRLPHARAVTAAMLAVSILTAALVVTLLYGHQLFW